MSTLAASRRSASRQLTTWKMMSWWAAAALVEGRAEGGIATGSMCGGKSTRGTTPIITGICLCTSFLKKTFSFSPSPFCRVCSRCAATALAIGAPPRPQLSRNRWCDAASLTATLCPSINGQHRPRRRCDHHDPQRPRPRPRLFPVAAVLPRIALRGHSDHDLSLRCAHCESHKTWV